METLKVSTDTLFILLGAIMVLAMHSGFAFLEVGTVRKKNQVNALVKILCDFAVSTIAYFFIGYSVAYGVNFFVGAEQLAEKSGYELTKFFFLLTFAAAVPAIISGGIAERARFNPQLLASALIVGFIYPFYEGIVWNENFGEQIARPAERVPGSSQLTISVGGERIELHTYKPPQYDGGPILLVLHGLGANAAGNRDYAIPLADARGFLVVAPLFDRKRFPTWRYQTGGLVRTVMNAGAMRFMPRSSSRWSTAGLFAGS